MIIQRLGWSLYKKQSIYYSCDTLKASASRNCQTIEKKDVTDPLNHSIIEKCARIKQVFKQITPHEEYVITGQKGEVKRITLDRDLVEWE